MRYAKTAAPRRRANARRGITEPQGQSGQTSKCARERQETLGGRPGEAPDCHPDAEVRVPAQRSRIESKRVHRPAAFETSGVDPKTRQVGASERDRWLRAAWRALVA